MSSVCREVRAQFAAYAEEALTPSERGALREHLALCGPCREEAAADDATLLFASAVPPAEVSEADMARILQGVRAGVALKRAERRLARPPRRAAAVAAAAAVALFTLALRGGPGRDARDSGSRGTRLAEPASAAAHPSASASVRTGLAKSAGAPADAHRGT